eukprot:NODE_2957_length_1080_cov_17.214355_g2712_i0.p1 GENE.NODE_2957_length_1080_cov_17.214355_g2712_i0~~NODE_2957_length_1080_cov_17.214355_g2712_i0.p1  ORF type:complete len:186 (-),score=22.96 NODE_2957_length_1080_cov_17.214355_g2712_i0:404-961(-)
MAETVTAAAGGSWESQVPPEQREQEDAVPPAFKLGRGSYHMGVGVGVFVLSKAHPGCILLGQRLGSTGSGRWALPGGHLEFGETLEHCAIREVKEETLLDITNSRFGTLSNSIDRCNRYHYLTPFVVAEALDNCEPVNTEPTKCAGWHWIEWDSPDFPRDLFRPLEDVRRAGFSPFGPARPFCEE